MSTKRCREDIELERTIAVANYLIFLSNAPSSASSMGPTSSGRVYECRTCNRKFPSFQALGGHRASHKKPRPSMGGDDHMMEDNRTDENARKSKTHACSICGLEFPIGQALGGHMRRHRAALTGSPHLPSLSLSLEASSHSVAKSSGVTRSSSNHDHDHRRVMCLDLNLTPLENGLLEVRKLAPVVC